MSLRDKNTVYSSYLEWPFADATSTAQIAARMCNCPTDEYGRPVNPESCQCEAGLYHGYPLGLSSGFATGVFARPRQIPAVRITRPDENVSRPVEKKTAIESLKAVSSLKSKQREPLKQGSNGYEHVKNGSGSILTTNQTTSHKENDNPRKTSPNAPQVDAQDFKSIQNQTRASLGALGTRSVSYSTDGSSGGGTTFSWKNSMTGSETQTTISGELERDPKGKGKAIWTEESQEYMMAHNVSNGSIHGPEPAKDNKGSSESRGSRKTSGSMKMVLGCSHCLFEPTRKVVPCDCRACEECAQRYGYGISHGSEVYCGCGERVWNMSEIVQQQTNIYSIQPTAKLVAQSYSPSTIYSPASFVASPISSTGAVQFSSPTPTGRYQPTPLRSMRENVGVFDTIPEVPEVLLSHTTLPPRMPVIPDSTNPGSLLSLDPDTAFQHAPFVDLGRNSLPQNWSCVKIGNIPYNVTSEELLEFLGKNSNIVPEIFGSIGVHVIMDRSTGKTMDAYVEFMNSKDAWKCVSRRRSRVLGNRHLSLDVVDTADLMKDVFPRAKGIVWDGVVPRPAPDKSEFGAKTEIISREELVLIVQHARTPHRSPFSRKCLQRPFQSLMSIVSKFPWFATDCYTIAQRDYIFQALLQAVDILKRQIKRGRTMPNLDLELLKALLRVGIRCSGFTDSQKYDLVKAAEFGADGIQVDADINSLSGFEALGKAIGAERKVLEFYTHLFELSATKLSGSPFMADNSSQGLEELIKPRNTSKQPQEESKKGHLTMAQASSMEWAAIEQAVHSVLEQKSNLSKHLKKGTTSSYEKHVNLKA